jgi:hypothetical protein
MDKQLGQSLEEFGLYANVAHLLQQVFTCTTCSSSHVFDYFPTAAARSKAPQHTTTYPSYSNSYLAVALLCDGTVVPRNGDVLLDL